METKEQRRTRLVEEYAGKHLLPQWGEHNPCAAQVVFWAKQLADEVIKETPEQGKALDGPCDSEQSELIYHLYIHCDIARNLILRNLPAGLVVREWLDEFELIKERCRKAGIFGGT